MDLNIKICPICGFQTENGRVMSNHKRWQHIVDRNSEEYENFRKKLKEKSASHQGVTVEKVRKAICPECGKEFNQRYMENSLTGIKEKSILKYCSSFCAHKQGSKSVDYLKSRLILSKKQKEHPTGCFSVEWKLAHPESNVARKFMSKRELEIVDFFKKSYPDDEWKQGLIDGGRRHDGILINPDLWSKKLKVVIEYDGIWHFKDIHNQLERKQNVDRITKRFCEENGYRLIRVDEMLNISNEKIAAAVYNDSKQLELFGSKRYNYLFD